MEKENRLDELNTSTDRKLSCKFVTEEAQLETEDRQTLRQRVNALEDELRNARERENRLRVTNSQLSSMVCASNKQTAARTQQYLGLVEQALLEKLHVAYRNSLIDQKISEVAERERKSNGKGHQRTLSNWSTLSSCPSQESRPNKKDIRDRLAGIKRMQRQLTAQ